MKSTWKYLSISPRLHRCSSQNSSKTSGSTNAQLNSLESIPGPISLPGVGTEWVYSVFGPYSRKNMHHTGREGLYAKYGPIYKERLGGASVVSIHDPRDISRVLSMQGKTPIRLPNEANIYLRKSRPDLYNSVGLVDSDGEEWQSLRRKVSSAIFPPDVADKFIPDICEVADDFTRLIQQEKDSNGCIKDASQYLYRFALEIIWKCVIGERIGALKANLSKDARDLIKNSTNLFDCLAYFSMARPYWKTFPSPLLNKFKQTDETLFKIVGKHADARIQGKLQFDSCPNSNNPILSNFLSQKDLDKRDAKTVLVDFIAAGIATTAFSLSFLLHEIGKNPKLQKLIQQDLDTILDSDLFPANYLSLSPILKATIKEGHRLKSIIPMLGKLLPESIELQGYFIPAYTPLLCQTRMACRLEENFSRPLEFLPERWLHLHNSKKYNINEDIMVQFSNHKTFLVLPFGRGARMCIGARLAHREMWILVAKILQKYTIESRGELDIMNNLVLKPAGPVKLIFKER